MEPGHDVQAPQPPAMAPGQQPWEYSLRKYLLLLATLVVTVTYDAAFNPPGGVWQDGTHDDVGQGQRLAGDPVIRDTHYHRYIAFFYCNATAFAMSLVLIVLILILAVRHDKEKEKKDAIWVASDVVLLRAVMVLDLLSLVGAYAAGTCRDKVSTVYSAVLVAAVFIYIVVIKLLDWWFPDNTSGSGGVTPTPKPSPSSGSGAMSVPIDDSDSGVPRVQEKEALKKLKAEERFSKVLMLLATFAVSITYVAGLSTPGGFWDNTEGGHRAGEAILMDRQMVRLRLFYVCNTTAFAASLVIITVVLLDTKSEKKKTPFWCSMITLVGIVGAYIASSTQETATVAYLVSLIIAFALYVVLLVAVGGPLIQTIGGTSFGIAIQRLYVFASDWLQLQGASYTDVR
jgi:hypothetical protein